MSSVTEAGALADLVNLVDGITGIEVIDHEFADVRNGMATVRLTGGTPTDYRYVVNVYVRGGDQTNNQSKLHGYRQSVEDALRMSAQFVMNEYSYDQIDGTDAWFCAFDLVTGREDF